MKLSKFVNLCAKQTKRHTKRVRANTHKIRKSAKSIKNN